MGRSRERGRDGCGDDDGGSTSRGETPCNFRAGSADGGFGCWTSASRTMRSGRWPTTGGDLPSALRGARERVFGIGPEIGITIPALRAKLMARYEWDVGARARPAGQVLVASLSFLAWRPP